MPPGLIQKLILLASILGAVLMLWQNPIGKFVLSILAVFLVLYGLVLYLHKHNQPLLAGLYTKPGCKEFIDLVCRWSKKQPPVDPSKNSQMGPAAIGANNSTGKEHAHVEELLVSEPQHFDQLSDHLAEHVCGHDDNVQRLVRGLERNITLRRKSREEAKLAPLGVFLFAGAPGTGKRHLATLAGRSIYKSRHLLHLDMRDFSDDSGAVELFGSSQHDKPGRLIEEVMKHPFHSILLDNIERSAPSIFERLGRICKDGTWKGTGQESPVSFKHCVFFFLTSAGHEALNSAKISEITDVGWARVSEVLVRETSLPSPFLAAIQDILVFRRPDELDLARVIAGLMEKECRKYDLRLDHVEAEVLAQEVFSIPAQEGLESVPARVVRLMKKPLAKAVESRRRGVVVKTVRSRNEKVSNYE